jgi:hypothetical protein
VKFVKTYTRSITYMQFQRNNVFTSIQAPTSAHTVTHARAHFHQRALPPRNEARARASSCGRQSGCDGCCSGRWRILRLSPNATRAFRSLSPSSNSTSTRQRRRAPCFSKGFWTTNAALEHAPRAAGGERQERKGPGQPGSAAKLATVGLFVLQVYL